MKSSDNLSDGSNTFDNMTTPLVSVIMPCFKMGRFIREALASVGEQSYCVWEVIAVDDCGPEDGTRQAVQDFMSKFPNHRVQYIRHDTNRGVSAARNTAIEASRGELLAFLDPDDVWLPTKIEQQVNKLEANSSAVACFSLGLIERQGDGCLYAPGTNIMGHFLSPEQDVDTMMVANATVLFPFSSVVLRKTAFNRVGGFQEALPFQNEDRFLLGCAALFGTITGFAEPLCIYRVHDTSVTTTVIKSNAANIVEFDLTARIALWLHLQKHGRLTGSKVLQGPVCKNLRKVLKGGSILKWRGILMKLSAQMMVAYPGQAFFLAGAFMRELLFRTFRIRPIHQLFRRRTVNSHSPDKRGSSR